MNDRLHVIVLSPEYEDRIAEGVEHTERGLVVRMKPVVVEEINQGIAKALSKLVAMGVPPVLVVDPRIRPAVRQITEAKIPDLHVLSLNEITKDTYLESYGAAGSDT
jgi:flagellar biosynthesis protein FlhA